MHDKPTALQALMVLAALVGDVVTQHWFGFSFRAPRFTTLAIAIIGLRWGSVEGAYWGAGSGLVLALYAGELPFAATAALAASGWLAGEIRGRVVIESYRAIGLALAAPALAEWALVSLFLWMVLPGGINGALWAIGWAIVVGPLFYRLVVRLSTPPPEPSMPAGPE